jgi:dihydroneopterin aldolase
LLITRETATAYELHKTINYREQYEKTGFIMTPSRKKLVDEAIEKLIS